MERRSRSQVRRLENGVGGGGLSVPRHASSSRADPSGGGGGGRVVDHPHHQPDHRTLSPDRKDRYRSSGRGGYSAAPAGGVGMYTDGYQQNGYAPPPLQPPDNIGGGGGMGQQQHTNTNHSNANSYNQYNHHQAAAYRQNIHWQAFILQSAF